MTAKKSTLFSGYMAIIYSIILFFVLVSCYYEDVSEPLRFFYYFTQQSNIIVLIWLFLYGIDCFHRLPMHKFIHNKTLILALTVYISITFFVVAFILMPIYTGQWNLLESNTDFFLHGLTPVVMWIYFFIVPGEGKLSSKTALPILIYPLLYMIANFFIGANFTFADGEPAYAYLFINPSIFPNIGIFIAFIVVLAGIFYLFALGLVLLKKKIEAVEESI